MPASDHVEQNGVKMRVFEDDGRTAVTWRRNGRTCILSSTDVPTDQMVELAAWKGQGAVDF